MTIHIFDLDGTLLDSNSIWVQIDIDFLGRRGFEMTPEYEAGVIHAIFPTAAQFTKEYCHLEESPEDIMAEWMEMAYEAYAHQLPMKPFARAYLEQCRKRGETMAIYTSCESELCQAALEHHGLTGYFSQVIYARELGQEKRSPGAFRAVLERLGAKAEDCLFYDDSPLSCQGARSCGIPTVGVHDPLFADREAEMRRDCGRYIRSFEELLE